MPNIYIVEGRCGEYSDRQQWMVKAYGTEEAARACVDRCDDYMASIQERLLDEWDNTKREVLLAGNPDDPCMTSSYGDVSYGVYQVPFDPS